MVKFHGSKEDPPPPKCETLDQDLTSIEMEELHDYEVVELCSGNGYHKL